MLINKVLQFRFIQYFMDLFEQLPTPAVCLGPDSSIVQINRLGRNLLQWREREVSGLTFDKLIAENDRDKFHSYLGTLSERAEGGFKTEILLPSAETAQHPPHKLAIHIKGSSGPDDKKILIFNHILNSISGIENARMQHKPTAYHDALTLLPNRRLFHDLLGQSLKQAHRNNNHVGVLFLDLDNFKNFNDRYGHDVGDKLLMTVASTLKGQLRGSDILCRWGADEFVVGLLGAENENGVLAVADKLWTGIVAGLPQHKHIPPIGVSIGVAIYPQHGLDPDLLIRNADAAMDKAKRAGKNRCILFDPDRAEPRRESARQSAI